MTPGVSAGSNHVGASVMVTANVIFPSGATARASGAGVCARTDAVTVNVRPATSASARDTDVFFIASSRLIENER